MNVLPSERELGYRLDDDIRAAGGRVSDDDTGREQCEVNELPAVHGKVLYLLGTDHGIDRSACRFYQGQLRGDHDFFLHRSRWEGEIETSDLANHQLER